MIGQGRPHPASEPPLRSRDANGSLLSRFAPLSFRRALEASGSEPDGSEPDGLASGGLITAASQHDLSQHSLSQHSPSQHHAQQRSAQQTTVFQHDWIGFRRLELFIALLGSFLLGWLLLATQPSPAQELDNTPPAGPQVTVSGLEPATIPLRLRAQWGGESAVRWTGRMWLSEGDLRLVANLCLDPMSPGSKYVQGDKLLLSNVAPVSYDGVDFEVEAPEDATLHIEFDHANSSSLFVAQIKLTDLLRERFTKPMGEDHRFSLQRTANDRLRFRFDHPHLVFETGEATKFDLLPHYPGLAPNTEYEIAIWLTNVAAQAEQDSLKVPVVSDDRGNLSPIEGIEMVIPPLEGAYNLNATITPKRGGAPFIRPRPVLEAMVQFVAIDPQPIADPGEGFGEAFEIDPAKPGWWDRLRALPQLRVLPGLSKSPMGNEKSRLVSVGSKTWTELESGGWVAYPLPLKSVGEPYLIEVEYDPGQFQQLGVSMVEPNSAGRFAALGIDMGVDVRSPFPGVNRADGEAGSAWFRAVVWPNTSVPLLVLHNPRNNGPARFGKLKVSIGSGRLPTPGGQDASVATPVTQLPREDDLSTIMQSLESNSTEQPSAQNAMLQAAVSSSSNSGGSGDINFNASAWEQSSDTFSEAPVSSRIVGTYLDTPLFADSFSAPERFDEATNRTLDDWYSFWLGGRRLIEHLRYQGQSAAVLTVLSEGSAIYESDLLQATPKYDSGTFFSSGQDPHRKDVLEMLFRLFDRESMLLIPQIEFATPLPAVEAERRRRTSELTTNNDLLLMTDTDVFQRPDMAFMNQRSGRYNPLSPAVQAAMSEVIEELCERYSHHPSFGGISIRIDDRTFTHFPDDRFGYDFSTVSQYLRETGQFEGSSDTQPPYQDYVKVVRTRPEAWLEWRQQKLTEFYQQLADLVSRSTREARLYLSVSELFRDANSVRLLHPQIQKRAPDTERTLLAKGLGLRQLKFTPGITVLSPYRLSPLQPLAASRVEQHLETSGELNAVLGDEASHPGSLIYQVTKPYELEGFAEANPFAQNQDANLLFPQLVGSDAQIRRPFALRLGQQDQLILFEGGMMTVHGQQRALGHFFQIFERLPAVIFEEVEIETNAARQRSPIVFRKQVVGGKTYAYAVNTTPWRVVVDLTVSGTGPINGQFLTGLPLPLIPDQGNPVVLQLTLEPFGLEGMWFSSDAIEFTEVSTRYDDPAQIATSLNKELEKFQAELGRAGGSPIPWEVIDNHSFEIGDDRSGIDGWELARGEAVSVARQRTSDAHTGNHAVRLSSNGRQFAWMRSRSFDPPKSGRLSISVWLKLPPNESQPPLRLALEGLHQGREYYRFAEVGEFARSDNSRQLTNEWKRFAVHFDDLPPDELSNLRIGFDMMGAGDVWIDDVKVYDLWLDNDDVIALATHRLNLHDALQRGDYVGCLRYLETYWSQVLLNQPSRRRESDDRTADQRSTKSPNAFSRGLLEKMKSLAPQEVLRLR